MKILCVNMVILKEGKADKRMNSLEMREKNEKFLKPILKKILIVQNTRFSQLNQVASKSPGQAARHLRRNIKKFVEVFFTIGSSTYKEVVKGAVKIPT